MKKGYIREMGAPGRETAHKIKQMNKSMDVHGTCKLDMNCVKWSHIKKLQIHQMTRGGIKIAGGIKVAS